MNHLERLFKKDEGEVFKLKKDEVVESAITALSSVCATDFKATEIEIGICSSAEEGGFRTVSCAR
jgi:20S proteasome subunit alpha 1